MKYIILFIILLFAIASCQMFPDYDSPDLRLDEYTYESISDWVLTNIKYTKDIVDEWQNPGETIDLMAGDCEDRAILFLYLVNKYLGEKADLQGIHFINSEINHMTAIIDDYRFNLNRDYDFIVLQTIPYHKVFGLTKYY